ncbi:MAG: hypothetical protein IJW66_00760, partial [Clostridia bacterium]|nr:hypothetical protein [Clostridia bacterium]
MKVKRLLVILLSLVLLIGSVFAVGISADETAAPEFEIVSKNIAYDGDMKLLVAVPKASFDDDITLTIEWTENTGSARGVETVTTAEALRADGIADPTINGVECYAVMAGRGVSAKDTGTELTITIRATKDGAEVTYSEKYSVLQYVYAKLYENEILYAEEGTPNAARRALYLSTIKFAKYAEKVLYDNLNTDTSDDLEIHADEWIYSDLEGTPKLYKPGDKITLNGYTKLLQYTLNGSTVEAVKTFASGEVTLSAAVSILENPDKTETFDQGIVDTDYITPEGGSVTVDTVDGNKVLVSTSEAGSIKVDISDRVYDRDNANDTYVFNADFHLDAGAKIGDITFHDAEGNVVYTLSLDTAKATYYYPEAKTSAIVTAAFAEAGWHTLEVELYQNNRVKVYVDGTCYLGYVDGNARGKDISALSYAKLSLANAKYDNVGFAVCDKTFSDTNFVIDFENGNVQDNFGKLAVSGAAFSLASDLADKADTALKVAISGSEAENSNLTIDLTNEDPQGSLYVFEMDIKGTSYTNTGDRQLMTLTFGDDTNNNFNLYNKYGSNNNYGKGMSFGLGGRNILADVYTYNAATDTSYVLTYNEWYTLRLELDLGATPEVRVLVKSSATGNVMTQVASITTDGTTVTVPGATRTPATKLNTAALVDVDSVNLSFNKVNVSNTYIDNLSFTRTTNVADGETKCDHSTMGAWENVVAASCNVFGEDVRRCACGNAACDYVETRQLDKLEHSEGVVVPRKDPTCISTGYEAYIGCPNCFEVTEGEFIVLDKIPHNLVGVGAIVDNKQDLACNAGECGITVEDWIVASAGNGVLNFTDYAITERVSGNSTYYDLGDGNAYIAAMSSATLDANAPSVGNPYVTYSVTGDGALKVQTVVANYNTYKGPALYLKTTNTNPSGTKYALDFDIYAEHSMTDNTSRVLTQLVFGGNVISLMTYGTNVCIYGASSKVLGAANEWISVRVEYTVTSDGNGTAELIVKDNDGSYRTVHTATLSGSAIKVAGVSSVYLSSFSTDINHTYYLDNLSLIRVDTNCYHMDGEDYRVESWTQTKDPTCTTLGEKQGICTECGETVTVEIPMDDHIASDWIIDNYATCVEDGSKHKECTVCHTVLETEILSATGDHDISGWTEVDGGYKKGCATCDTCDEYTETISGGVVHFNDGTILAGDKITVTLPNVEITGSDADKAATSFTNNNISLSIVNDAKAQVNNVLKVVIDPAQKTGTDATIDVKLADDNAEGNLLVFEMEFKNSTYTNSGGAHLFNIKIGNNNFYVYPKYGNASNYGKGLNFGIGGRNILFNRDGYTYNNEAFDTAFVLPYNEWNTLRLEIDVDKGEMKTFVKSSATSNVLEEVATTTTEGTTASFGPATTESTAKLDVTGLADLTSVQIQINDAVGGVNNAATTNYLDNLSFNIFDTRCYHENITDWNETVAPDCITEGEKQAVCPDCGETVVETVPALGHELVDVDGKAATCTEPGYTAHKACSRCDYTEGYEVIEALDHTESEWIVSIPAGCFTDGEHYKICTVCGEEIAREPIVATGHTFGAWTDTDDATIEKRSCEVCGRYQLREKDYKINFENGAILDANNKFQITVGALTGEGDASVSAGAGLTEFGNARLSLSLVDDVDGKVLKVIQTQDANYAKTTAKIYHTDAVRS